MTSGHSKARRLGKEEEKEKKKNRRNRTKKILNICLDRQKYRDTTNIVTRELWELKAEFKFHLRFEVLMVVTLMTDQVWDVTPCRLVYTVISGDVLLHLLLSLKKEAAKCPVFVAIYTNLHAVTSQKKQSLCSLF